MKYNSIGEQLIAKAKELDPNYKPDKFNDMSEAIDILLNHSGGSSSEGGDIWFEIATYLNSDLTTISQEGFDLVWNAFAPSETPINKYAGIMFFYIKCYFDGIVISGDKQGIKFVRKSSEDEISANQTIIIYDDKSVMIIESDNSNLTLPQTAPSSQVIPSITTSKTQQNLSIGDGLVIENGALKTKEKIKIFKPAINVKNINYLDNSYAIQIIFNNNIFNDIKKYVNSLISANKSFSTQLFIKSEKYSNYQFIANGSGTFYDLAELPFGISLLYDNAPGYFQTVSVNVTNDNSSYLYIQTYESLYSNFKSLAPMVFTNNTVIRVSVISYD